MNLHKISIQTPSVLIKFHMNIYILFFTEFIQKSSRKHFVSKRNFKFLQTEKVIRYIFKEKIYKDLFKTPTYEINKDLRQKKCYFCFLIYFVGFKFIKKIFIAFSCLCTIIFLVLSSFFNKT